ncbi:hypothetical protein [Corynebacterium meridianum]|nr:hypothetical protein [Corynebacterium meridianum]
MADTTAAIRSALTPLHTVIFDRIGRRAPPGGTVPAPGSTAST